MKQLVTHAFTRTKTSGNYRSDEWATYDQAANRLGFNSWINWKWVKDNMRYDKRYIEGHGNDRSMDEIYRTKAGVCRHGAYFTLETIERGARSAELLAINYRARDGKTGWHAIVTENDNVGVWIVMNFDYDGAKPITGPFRSNDEAVKRIVKDFGGSLITWRAEDATIGYHQ